jgi:hypothetical protein
MWRFILALTGGDCARVSVVLASEILFLSNKLSGGMQAGKIEG